MEYVFPQDLKKTKKIKNYFELFVGGGALFFHLMNNYKIKNAYINDVNTELIITYNVIKNNPKELIGLLLNFQDLYWDKTEEDRKKIYLDVRSEFNENLKTFDFCNYSEEHIERAAQTIFLNKTCFNGLFRLNLKGEFNVPKGRYKNPKICDKENLLAVSNVLKNVKIFNKNYYELEEYIDGDSFVYLDPPYRPITKSSFNSYSKENFDDESQKELATFFKKIHNKGAKVLESNSDPKNNNDEDNFFDDLYCDFKIERIKALRFINANGNKRGHISELLIYNY